MTQAQLQLFDSQEKQKELKNSRTGTFTDNMKLPIHRWFRYSAGFSAEWAEQTILDHATEDSRVLDPFVGSGTTVIASEKCRIPSVGLEAHPFISKIAQAKLSWKIDVSDFLLLIDQFIKEAKTLEVTDLTTVSPLIEKCYDEDTLKDLLAIRENFQKNYNTDNKVNELLWLCITSILRECSSVGTAQWQYVLPNKKKKNAKLPFEALLRKAHIIAKDIEVAQKAQYSCNGRVILSDARNPDLQKELGKNSFDLVITSPPYPNNYDYADATRLEMTYWGEVESWGDLHTAVRQFLIRSCSQHTAKERLILDELLDDPILLPIKDEIVEVCNSLSEIRMTKGGKKTYHTMIAAYFCDLGYIFENLSSLCTDDAKMCFVIGDSAPYGVYVPVDKWLGELAMAAGFSEYSFEKIRDRNIKWKNRKHRVPLKEGNLWITR